MSKRRLYRETILDSITNTTTQTFTPKTPHDPKYVLYVTAASMEDATAAPTTISFGKLAGGVYTPFEEEGSVSAGIRYHIEKTHVFVSGEEPAVRVEGGGSGNVISAYLEGYEEEV